MSDQKPLTAGGGTTGAAPPAVAATSGTRGGGAGLTLRSKDDSRSLVVLEVLLYLNLFYIGIFWLLEILMFIFKGQSLPYTYGTLAGEVILVFAICIVDLIRVALCSYGNLAANRVAATLGILLTALTILGVIYLLFFQVYTLRAELITCSLALVFHLLSVLMSIGALISMS